MKAYLLILASLLLVGLVTYFIVDPSQDFTTIEKQPICLSTQSNLKVCAHCYRRDANLQHSRAFKIQSSQAINLLKVGEQQEYLTCYEYLQMINTQKDTNNGKEIYLQALAPIQQILAEIKGTWEVNKEKKALVVQPWYNQFVIYKWGDTQTATTRVLFPNPEQQKIIKFYFFYAFNFILLMVLIAWIADSAFINEQTTPIKLSLACIAILIQLYLLEINSQLCLYVSRLFVLNLGLLRMKVNNFKVMFLFAIGLVGTYFQSTIPIYIIAVLMLMYYYGRSQLDSKDIQIYFVSMYTLMLFNHVHLYQNVYLLNDFKNIVIDLCLLILMPLGLFLLPKSKQFRPYRPVDPEIRSISLSGYDEEEPTTI